MSSKCKYKISSRKVNILKVFTRFFDSYLEKVDKVFLFMYIFNESGGAWGGWVKSLENNLSLKTQ